MSGNDYDYRKQLQSDRRAEWNKNAASETALQGRKLSDNNNTATGKPVSVSAQNKMRGSLMAVRNRINSRGDENDEPDESDENSFVAAGKSLEKAMAGPKWKVPFEATKLGFKLRKAAADHKKAPWIIVIIFAIIVDIADITWILGFFLKVVLFIFLWGRGTWKVRITCRILLFFDMVPFVSWLPLSTIAVLYAWRKSSKEAKLAEKRLHKNKGRFFKGEDHSEELAEAA